MENFIKDNKIGLPLLQSTGTIISTAEWLVFHNQLCQNFLLKQVFLKFCIRSDITTGLQQLIVITGYRKDQFIRRRLFYVLLKLTKLFFLMLPF